MRELTQEQQAQRIEALYLKISELTDEVAALKQVVQSLQLKK